MLLSTSKLKPNFHSLPLVCGHLGTKSADGCSVYTVLVCIYGWVFVTGVKLLCTGSYHILVRVPGLVPALLFASSFLLMYSGRPQLMAQMVVSLPPP